MSRRRKKQKETINFDVKSSWDGKKGHTNHQSGSGEHQDKRTKRQHTRRNQLKAHLEEIE